MPPAGYWALVKLQSGSRVPGAEHAVFVPVPSTERETVLQAELSPPTVQVKSQSKEREGVV